MRRCPRSGRFQTSARSWPRWIAGDSMGLRQHALVDRCRVDAAAVREHHHTFGIHPRLFQFFDGGRRIVLHLEILEAAQTQLAFGACFWTMIPECLSCPGVATKGFPAIKPGPGMMTDYPIAAEELYLTQFATQSVQKAEARIHVV